MIKVAQAVCGEKIAEQMLDTLMRTALEHAGAERGLLILIEESTKRIAAEAVISGESIRVHMREEPVSSEALPETILQRVVHTQEGVILDDASALNPFSADPYICRHRTRSLLCLPICNHAELAGVLYFENNDAPHAFTAARISVLKLLASQAAMSLENTRLYRDLAEREARIRRLVDANIVGIETVDLDGLILEANDAF